MLSTRKSLWAGLCGFALSVLVGCTQVSYPTPPKRINVTPSKTTTVQPPRTTTSIQTAPQNIVIGKVVPLPVPTAPQQPSGLSKKVVPYSYVQWLAQGENRQRVQAYENYLQRNQVANIVPMHELLRTARSWEKCGYEEYAIPTQELWGNSISTLKVFKYLISMNILTDFEVTSVYRDLTLNECAGGAKASKHVFNAAIDFRLGSEYPQPHELVEIEQSKNKLCHFWIQHGAGLDMGLGVYRSGQIHIDTQGFRTWGPSLGRDSSPCYYLIQSLEQQGMSI